MDEQQTQQIHRAEADDQIYSNVIAMKGGPYDVTLVFGRRSGSSDPRWQTEVTMSWEHARSMLVALEKVLKDYEGKMGEIRDIEGIIEAEIGADG